ncbi:MAG: hypothetical protein LBD59_11720 [Prevotellaceae bacterium]|nr:hypothetical protein [Prevotellaceae bacterium]
MRKIFRRMLYSLLALTAVLTLAVSVAIYVIFTPERITPIVLKYANDYLDAKLECESVDITFFSTFPNFGIRLRNGNIVTRPSDSCDKHIIYDTLLSFSNFVTSFDPLALYRSNRLVVRNAWLEQPVIYACVDSAGKANWNILPQTVDTATSGAALPEITVKNIHISKAGIVYDNHHDSTFVAAEGLQLDVGGSLTDVNLKMRIDAATVFINNKSYTSQLPLSLAARVKSDERYQHFSVEQSSVSVGFMDFDLAGTVERDTCNGLSMAVDFNLHAASLADLLAAVPEHLFDAKQFPASGKINFSGRIEGVAGNGQTPLCTASLRLTDGEVKNRKRPDKPLLQQIEIDCDARLDKSGDTPSYIEIKTLKLKNESTRLSVDGAFVDIFTRPFINLRIDGAVDFLRFWENMPSGQDLMNMRGTAKLNVAGKCFLDDLLEFDYGKIDATGSVDVNGATFNYPSKHIALYAPMTKIRMGSHVTDSIRGYKIASLFRATAEMDSLNFRWSNDLSLDAGLLQATFRTSEPKDSVSIAEIAAYLNLSNLRMQSAIDSTLQMQATRMSALVKLGPQAAHPTKTELKTRLSIDSLSGRLTDIAGRIHNSSLALTLRYRDLPARLQPRADSLIRNLRRDSAMLSAARNSAAIDFRLGQGEAREFLSHWDLSGSFKGQSINLQSPWFPLRTSLSSTSFTFTSDSISVASAHLQAGESNMHLKGKITGIRRALLRNGQITAKLDMETDSLDCNEIIRALAAASDYAERHTTKDDSIDIETVNAKTTADSSAFAIDADTLPAGLFVVPRNLDIELNASMKRLRYSHLNLLAAGGKIIVRNGSVRIPNLNIRSELGNADLSIVYKAPTTKGAYIGLDAHTEHIRIGELRQSLPVLDSLAPVMRSLDGVVECRITAVSQLDSLSNVLMPATRASCYINGKNMALLDGETFAKIAKTLHFKNKKRNIIDSVAVEFALDDGKIYVFPFVMNIDRYTAAIGGTQNLDLSFQYHISILKWPVPLVKVGLNLWGTPDNVHYSLASRKYADMGTPVKTQSLESTVFNLRQQMYDALRKSIDDILNETPAPRRSPLMNSDMNSMLFSIDNSEPATNETNNENINIEPPDTIFDSATTDEPASTVDTTVKTEKIIDN